MHIEVGENNNNYCDVRLHNSCHHGFKPLVWWTADSCKLCRCGLNLSLV